MALESQLSGSCHGAPHNAARDPHLRLRASRGGERVGGVGKKREPGRHWSYQPFWHEEVTPDSGAFGIACLGFFLSLLGYQEA